MIGQTIPSSMGGSGDHPRIPAANRVKARIADRSRGREARDVTRTTSALNPDWIDHIVFQHTSAASGCASLSF